MLYYIILYYIIFRPPEDGRKYVGQWKGQKMHGQGVFRASQRSKTPTGLYIYIYIYIYVHM